MSLHSDWKAVKTQNDAAIKAAKINFNLNLGKALERWEACNPYAGKKATPKEIKAASDQLNVIFNKYFNLVYNHKTLDKQAAQKIKDFINKHHIPIVRAGTAVGLGQTPDRKAWA
ncbi:MAG: hypothetical protein JST11_06720 [Acidobacteria bacterium]|nr:hypothetical protein [Acidobacteriota bacterium]